MPDIFGVIADATRRDILHLLLECYNNEAEISVSEIVQQLKTTQPTISKHLKVLRDSELVRVREDGQHRFYTLDPEPLNLVEDFLMPFLTAGIETSVSVEYLDDEGHAMCSESAAPVLPEKAAEAAERIGQAAALAEHRVKELVARFRLRA